MQEHLVRTGRLAEADQAWLAEALHGAAIADGPGALDAALDQILFILIWPRRTYSLQVELDLQLERLKACLGDSPSLGLFEESIEMAWPMACHKAQALDPALRHLLDAPCPWTTFDGLIAAVRARLAEDGAARLDCAPAPPP